MFRHEQEASKVFRCRPSLRPPRLPRLHSSEDAHGSCEEHYRPLLDRPRGRSLEEDNANLRAMLPSVASLMPPARHAHAHESRQQRQELPEFLYERRRAQTLPQSQPHAYAVASTPPTSRSPRQREFTPPSLTGLSAFADTQFIGMRSSRYAASPSNRWTPYMMSAGRNFTNESLSILWDDEETDGAGQSHRRRRTSPRRRLAESKARARAYQMATEGEQGGYFEDAQPRSRLYERSYEAALPRPATTLGLSMPMALRPPSPLLIDESDASPSKKHSRYLREMDRWSILARLDRGEKQSALAKEFRVTRAAICNLNKHRDVVLSRQHEDPLAKHPKKARRKQGAGGDAEPEEAATSLPSGSNRISRLLSAASPAHNDQRSVHGVALQPAERLIPLLLSSETSDADFRRYCDRLMTLVVEEVLAWTHTEASNAPGFSNAPTPCGIAIAPGGSPMLSVFQALEPELPTGHIKLGSPVALAVELPAAVTSHSVCLFYAFTDAAGGVRVAKSIRELLGRGAVEELLCLVTLAVSAFTVEELQRAHPSLRIAAAHVESQDDVGACPQQHATLDKGSSNQPSRLELLATRAAEIY
jgi:uracil phosphoribosyltransferase